MPLMVVIGGEGDVCPLYKSLYKERAHRNNDDQS